MIRGPLRLAVAQPTVVLHDVAGNALEHAAVVREAVDARVVVFPELSLTGYAMDVEPVGVTDSRLGPLVDACAETGALALVGAATETATGRYISTLVVDGEGIAVGYRKIYLGGEEPATFTPGSEPRVLEVGGWRLGLAICKDTGVADHAASTCALGIDAYVASVCEHHADAHVAGERAARVIDDHGVWVATASFAGPTGGGFERTAGGSSIWDPTGAVTAQVDDAPDQWCTTTLVNPRQP